MLSGGNALGAYHAGAWSALEEQAVVPRQLVGASIGAITAALVAGSPPGGRAHALDRFWSEASAFDAAATPFWHPLAWPMRRAVQHAQALAMRLAGRPALYDPRVPDVTGGDRRPSLFDAAPMRRLLGRLVDLERLNGGDIRVTVAATDLATGEEVVFDTARDRIELDHVMASAALIPDFAPVEIAGRLLADGGLRANLPLHLVLDEALDQPGPERLTCFAVDLFPLAAPSPRGVLQAAQRQTDLIFAGQTSRTLHAATREWAGREPGADVFLLAYEALEEETALKSFDFSAGALARRRDAGRADMRRQLEAWRGLATGGSGLAVHRTRRDA